MRVIIADDHSVVLLGLKMVLGKEPGRFTIVGEAHSADELLALVAQTPCDLLITDITMSETSGLEEGLSMLRTLRSCHPQLPILVLTIVENLALMKSIMAMGVQGFVSKSTLATEVLDAIAAVQAGKVYLSRRMQEKLADPMRLAGEDRSLSARETDVVRMLAQGMTVSEIAQTTHRSMATISSQKRNAMQKLGIERDKDLHDYARALGLI